MLVTCASVQHGNLLCFHWRTRSRKSTRTDGFRQRNLEKKWRPKRPTQCKNSVAAYAIITHCRSFSRDILSAINGAFCAFLVSEQGWDRFHACLLRHEPRRQDWLPWVHGTIPQPSKGNWLQLSGPVDQSLGTYAQRPSVSSAWIPIRKTELADTNFDWEQVGPFPGNGWQCFELFRTILGSHRNHGQQQAYRTRLLRDQGVKHRAMGKASN